jgi:hypothetical protein
LRAPTAARRPAAEKKSATSVLSVGYRSRHRSADGSKPTSVNPRPEKHDSSVPSLLPMSTTTSPRSSGRRAASARAVPARWSTIIALSDDR